jgi:hypothetical protein
MSKTYRLYRHRTGLDSGRLDLQTRDHFSGAAELRFEGNLSPGQMCGFQRACGDLYMAFLGDCTGTWIRYSVDVRVKDKLHAFQHQETIGMLMLASRVHAL